MHSEEEQRVPVRVVLAGVGVWVLSITVLIFLFTYVTPPFQGPSSLVKWFLWCTPAAVAGLAFLISWEMVVGPFFTRWLHGSGEQGDPVIRMGALGIAILIAVFVVIQIFFD